MPATKQHDSLAVFVCSSDNTRDVFTLVGPSFKKYWPDCPYSRYVGLNATADEQSVYGFIPVVAPVSDWRHELYTQIKQLDEEYVLLLLDDFLLLSPVNTKLLERLFSNAAQSELDYLRLIEIERSGPVKMMSRAVARLRGREIVPIPVNIPYYSSLQAAIWRKAHLLEMLRTHEGQNIWEFEHRVMSGHDHFAIVGSPPLHYRHIIERGRWLPYAGRLFRKRGFKYEPGRRQCWPASYLARFYFRKVVFSVVGYGWMRSKRWVKGLLSKNMIVAGRGGLKG